MHGRLEGKVCIITGAARGMGEATARLFASEGATVALGDVMVSEGTSVAEDIGGNAFFQKLDVSDDENCILGAELADELETWSQILFRLKCSNGTIQKLQKELSR